MDLDLRVARPARPVPGLLVAAVIAAAAVLLLSLLAGVHPPGAWDRGLFGHLHGHAGDPAARFARVLTRIGDGAPLIAVLTALGVGAWARWRTWSVLVVTGLAVVVSAAISTTLKILIDRQRPPKAGWLASADGTSFPSGHTTVATAGYVALALSVATLVRTTAVRTAAVGAGAAMALAIGWTRVELAVHWPTDVLAGWCVGACAACAAALLGPALLKRSLAAVPARPRPVDAT